MQRWVLADYGCQPIWQENANDVANVAPDRLELPGDLAARFSRWARTYDRAFDPSRPGVWGFDDAVSRDQFYEAGLALASELWQALQESTVHYFDDRAQRTRHVIFQRIDSG